MRSNIIVSAALVAALGLPTLTYAAVNSDPTQGQGGNGTAGAASNYNKTIHRIGSRRHYRVRHHIARHHTMNASPPASGGSAGAPGGGGCDPAATAASASAPVGQAAPGCK